MRVFQTTPATQQLLQHDARQNNITRQYLLSIYVTSTTTIKKIILNIKSNKYNNKNNDKSRRQVQLSQQQGKQQVYQIQQQAQYPQ